MGEELKWRAKKSQQETGPIIRKLYEVNGVTVKTPVSTAANKFRSVEIIKPLKPREVNKCWRRNPGSSPGDRLVEKPVTIVRMHKPTRKTNTGFSLKGTST